MSTFLECIVDVSIPIAGRWIFIQIASLFGADLNTNTLLWVVTVALCALVAEFWPFQAKKKSDPVEDAEAFEASENRKNEPIIENVDLS